MQRQKLMVNTMQTRRQVLQNDYNDSMQKQKQVLHPGSSVATRTRSQVLLNSKVRAMTHYKKNQILQNAYINAVVKNRKKKVVPCNTDGELKIVKQVDRNLKRVDIIVKLSENNMLELVFDKIEAEFIYEAARVCKKWKELLGKQSFIRSLYTSPTPYVSCGAFLVMFKYLLPKSQWKDEPWDNLDRNYDKIALVVGAQGQCSVITDCKGILGVTCNGLMCTIADKCNSIHMHVINPAVKTRKLFVFDGLVREPNFKGMSFDASTQVLTYLEAHLRPDEKDLTVRFLDSSKGPNKWRHLKYPNPLCRSPQGYAVCSWGIMWWVDNALKDVLGFRLNKRDFFALTLPPNAVSSSTLTSVAEGLTLKGGEGKVVLVSQSCRAAWELIKREDEFEWVKLELNFDMFPKPKCTCPPCEWPPRFVNNHYMNSYGWWLTIRKCSSKGPSILMCDSTGKLVHGWSTSRLASCIPYGVSRKRIKRMEVDAVWPFEINNICWPRA